MAQFVIGLGLSPSEYNQLTLLEREALITAHKQSQRKK